MARHKTPELDDIEYILAQCEIQPERDWVLVPCWAEPWHKPGMFAYALCGLRGTVAYTDGEATVLRVPKSNVYEYADAVSAVTVWLQS